MDEKILIKAKEWSNNSYFDEESRREITDLITNNSESELIERFHKNLEFGTGGMRAILGVGSNRMNKYNVRKATQAMCNVLKSENPQNPKAVISNDCRHYSFDFAKEVAGVFAANGIEAHLYPELTPTPMLSFALRHLDAHCGVMITASHNPKEYNGYKAYWTDGAQVTPPQDQMIIDEFNNINDWAQVHSIDFEKGMSDGIIHYIDKSVNDAYYNIILENQIDPKMIKEHGNKVNILYTALHGTGNIPCQEISKRMGITNFNIVKKQAVADPDFSTVKSPNPEDLVAMEMGIDQMLKTNADVVYGTDPDCDRLGVIVNQNGKAEALNGNQIAVLMLDYIFERKKELGTLPENSLVIKSVVTSEMQKAIVESFGGTVIDTLTGFKWMALKVRELENSDYNFIFASEESFGYMPISSVRDKDGVSSIALMNEIVLYYKLQNKTLVDALDSIYEKHGFYLESLISIVYQGLTGQAKIQKIMEFFRAYDKKDIAGYELKSVADLSTLKETEYSTGTTSKLDITQSNVLGFTFSNGDKLWVRPSGTEPKIKFYTMVRTDIGSLSEKKDHAKSIIDKIESEIKNLCESL